VGGGDCLTSAPLRGRSTGICGAGSNRTRSLSLIASVNGGASATSRSTASVIVNGSGALNLLRLFAVIFANSVSTNVYYPTDWAW
jgi:hypothetical protein